MPRVDAHDNRRLPDRDKTNPMAGKNATRLERLRRPLGNESQLVLRHLAVRFVFDPGNLPAIFK